jgi:hypothetical protein
MNKLDEKKNLLMILLFGFMIYFFSWLFIYKTEINTLAIQSEDTIPAIFQPVVIIKEKTLYLDTYYDMMLERYPHPDDKSYTKGLVPFYLRAIKQKSNTVETIIDDQTKSFLLYNNSRAISEETHYISAFPLIAGLLAVPVYFFPVVFNMSITWENLIILSHISSALIMAIAGGFFYLLLKSHPFSLNEKNAKLLTYVYLFGTINFAHISQALWQHGVVQLLSIVSLLLFFKGISPERIKRFSPSSNIWYLFFAGALLGFAFLARPTAAIYWPFLIVLLFQYLYKEIKDFVLAGVTFLGGLIPPAIFFIWYNFTYYKSLLNQGYSDQITSEWLGKLPEGALGMWISPSKGILIYSPIAIFSLIGLMIVVRELKRGGDWETYLKYIIFALIITLHTLVLGKWKHWYGGYSFGYRMLSDVLPLIILLMIPYVISDLFKKTKTVFYLLFGVSIAIQVYGLIFFDGVWHAAYDRGYNNTSWLWSLKDSELAFNIRRILVKLGLLERACPQCLPRP